eukprot:NODE_24225_length_633_cov_3.946640.p2 GENE.NODE_24225_length_633_cov_3.946640~~NODE_24225_length_633_cov_3.946640.p2  ORF type:complete len:114 (+),score=7.14 NODE_24225_length_633_cov_3.946640:36-377(+)
MAAPAASEKQSVIIGAEDGTISTHIQRAVYRPNIAITGTRHPPQRRSPANRGAGCDRRWQARHSETDTFQREVSAHVDGRAGCAAECITYANLRTVESQGGSVLCVVRAHAYR